LTNIDNELIEIYSSSEAEIDKCLDNRFCCIFDWKWIIMLDEFYNCQRMLQSISLHFI